MSKDEVIKDTQDHINKVNQNIKNFLHVMLVRGRKHDASKLEEHELPIFEEYTPKLATTTYMSDDYKKYLKEMKPALDHHYGVNSHHPEFYANGISDMSLFDITEMLMDWKAAVERHNDGDIFKSLEMNIKRFNISPDLSKILYRTIKMSMPFYVSYKKIDLQAIKEVYGKDRNTIINFINNDKDLNTHERLIILSLFTDTQYYKRIVDDVNNLVIEVINNSPSEV